MPTRRAISSIARTMLESFMSRNNEAGGYLAIGQLLQQALIQQQTIYSFDLLTDEASTVFQSEPLAIVPARYRALLWKQVSNRHWLKRRIQTAVCSIELKLTSPQPCPEHPERLVYPFTCSVKITDERGQTHERAASDWCWPHNPSYEQKSASPRASNGY